MITIYTAAAVVTMNDRQPTANAVAHPILGATTLATEVIATEDWVLPDRTFTAAHSHEEYVTRLGEADAATTGFPALEPADPE